MTTLRQTEKLARLSLALKALVGAGALVLISGGAAVASSTKAEQPVASETLRGLPQPNCAITVQPVSENAEMSDSARVNRPAAEGKALCRLVAAVTLSIRNNPGIF